MQIDNENMSNECCKSQEHYRKEKSQNGGGPTKIDESHRRRSAVRRSPVGSTITNNNFPDAIFVHDSVSHRTIKLRVLPNINLSQTYLFLITYKRYSSKAH